MFPKSQIRPFEHLKIIKPEKIKKDTAEERERRNQSQLRVIVAFSVYWPPLQKFSAKLHPDFLRSKTVPMYYL